MSVRGTRLILFLLLASVAFLPDGAAQLNPTVKLLPRATGPVPADCEEGLAPQPAQRVQVTEVVDQPRDATRDLEPPPSRDLRSLLRDAQAAAEANNRDAFKEALASSKAMLAAYPPGGERTGAMEVISVYDDLARLWDYQFDSPAGSFFDATSSGGALLSAMNKYRGFEDSIRRQVLTVDGTRIYPTRETREFLTREASQRLTRIGFPTPPRTRTPDPPRVTTAPAPQPTTRTPTVTREPSPRSTTPSTRRVESRPTPPRTTSSKPRSSTARKPSSTTSRQSVRPSAAPVDTPAIQPGPSVIATTTTAPPQPPRVDPAPTQTTFTETTAPPPTDTFSTDTTSTTSTSAIPAQGKGRNIILPLMLILIGIGVLIVLFRASS